MHHVGQRQKLQCIVVLIYPVKRAGVSLSSLVISIFQHQCRPTYHHVVSHSVVCNNTCSWLIQVMMSICVGIPRLKETYLDLHTLTRKHKLFKITLKVVLVLWWNYRFKDIVLDIDLCNTINSNNFMKGEKFVPSHNQIQPFLQLSLLITIFSNLLHDCKWHLSHSTDYVRRYI